MLFLKKLYVYFLFLFVVKIHAKQYERNNDVYSSVRRKRAVIQKNYKLEMPVEFYIDPHIISHNIHIALRRIEKKTCIVFEKSSRHVRGPLGFNFEQSYSCSAPFGIDTKNKYKKNTVFISPDCEKQVGIIEILVGKILGLLIENNRFDRDKYIDIQNDNIATKFKNQLKKYNKEMAETYGLGYDFYSGMHVLPWELSKNKYPVFNPTSRFYNHYHDMGQRYGLAFNDYKIITKHHCDDVCSSFPGFQCYNYGYNDPKNCSCICPFGFAGERCEEPVILHKDCELEKSMLNATSTPKTIHMTGKGTCSFLIKAKYRRNIKIEIKRSSAPYFDVCYPQKGHEIKYMKDKGVTGLSMCGLYQELHVTTEDNFGVVIYNGLDEESELIVTYKEVLKRSNYRFKKY